MGSDGGNGEQEGKVWDNPPPSPEPPPPPEFASILSWCRAFLSFVAYPWTLLHFLSIIASDPINLCRPTIFLRLDTTRSPSFITDIRTRIRRWTA